MKGHRLLIVILAIMALLAAAFGSCSEEEETGGEPETADQTTPSERTEPTKVKIGVISDKTGMASQVMGVVDMALDDLVKYFNENEVTPGVQYEVIYYDGQYDPSRDITGYKWLKERGADVIFANLPNTAVTIKPLADEDEMVVFSLFASEQATTPPGWVFCMNVPISAYAKTMLTWVADNDWDWETNGPAKIGGAGWTGPLWEELQGGAEEYCNAHPEQFQWIGGYLTDFAMTWGTEVEALKDCDYIFPPGVGLVTFAREYRQADGKAKFLCFESQSAVLGLTAQAAGWESLDGSLFALPNRWWNEDAELSNLANRLLYENHPDSAEKIRKGGISYIGGITEWYGVLIIIGEAVKKSGTGELDSQLLYETASSFSMSYDKCEQWDFTDSKRTSWNYLGIYEANESAQDLIRKDPNWHAVVN